MPKISSRFGPPFEIVILAGGLSSRMGRDKAKLRLSRWTLLGLIRRTAQQLGVPVRVIRRDLIPCCGPLGGVYTALRRARSNAVLFLSCDMPFVSPQLLKQLVSSMPDRLLGAFTEQAQTETQNIELRDSIPYSAPARNRARAPSVRTASIHKYAAGFPFVLRPESLPLVERLLNEKRFALQDLAECLRAKRVQWPKHRQSELLNVNTPEDWATAKAFWSSKKLRSE